MLPAGRRGQVAGVVLDAGAVAGLAQALQVVVGALLQAGGLEQLVLRAQLGDALLQLLLDVDDGGVELVLRGDEVLRGVDVDAGRARPGARRSAGRAR